MNVLMGDAKDYDLVFNVVNCPLTRQNVEQQPCSKSQSL